MTEMMGDALQNAGRLRNPDYLIAVLLLSLSNQHRGAIRMKAAVREQLQLQLALQ